MKRKVKIVGVSEKNTKYGGAPYWLVFEEDGARKFIAITTVRELADPGFPAPNPFKKEFSPWEKLLFDRGLTLKSAIGKEIELKSNDEVPLGMNDDVKEFWWPRAFQSAPDLLGSNLTPGQRHELRVNPDKFWRFVEFA